MLNPEFLGPPGAVLTLSFLLLLCWEMGVPSSVVVVRVGFFWLFVFLLILMVRVDFFCLHVLTRGKLAAIYFQAVLQVLSCQCFLPCMASGGNTDLASLAARC